MENKEKIEDKLPVGKSVRNQTMSPLATRSPIPLDKFEIKIKKYQDSFVEKLR